MVTRVIVTTVIVTMAMVTTVMVITVNKSVEKLFKFIVLSQCGKDRP